MPNKWLQHLKRFREQNSEMPPQKVMKEARKSYKQSGGAVVPYDAQNTNSTPLKLVGGKRQTKRQSRRSRRTRRR
jgi:hypothetical protein